MNQVACEDREKAAKYERDSDYSGFFVKNPCHSHQSRWLLAWFQVATA
jgi:hypothetical protein